MAVLKKIVRYTLVVALFFLLYVVAILIHGTIYDFQPEDIIQVKIEGQGAATPVPDTLSLVNWNIGYCGLGKESTFFYDNGQQFLSGDKWVRAPQEVVEKNLAGVQELMKSRPVDFYLFQEVDFNSKRSYFTNEYEKIGAGLPNYARTFAVNYDIPRVPLPILEPWNALGKMKSGLGTFSKYKPTASTRYQLPGKYSWPTRIFQLDRCLSVNRFATQKAGKELVIINVHNSAYDPGGKLKAEEMTFLKHFLLEEYKKGNYILCGGDWNQCPPNFAYDTFMEGKGEGDSPAISFDFMPQDWIFAYDASIPTNRSLVNPYQNGTTFTTLIDYYLVSPNIEIKQVQGVNNEFSFSDHQPIFIKVVLK